MHFPKEPCGLETLMDLNLTQFPWSKYNKTNLTTEDKKKGIEKLTEKSPAKAGALN